MNKLIRNTLQAASATLAGLLILGQGAFAAPQAAVVSPTTITSGGTVNVTMKCTVAGNVIDVAYLNPSSGTPTPISNFAPHTCVAEDVINGFTITTTASITGTTTETFTITYNESGSTAGGSPGTSPASNPLTVNPALPPDGDLAVSLSSTTSPSNEGDPYIVELTLENKGPAIAAVSGGAIRVVVSSTQLDGITLANPTDLAGWDCTPTYYPEYKASQLSCLYSGAIAAGQKIEFKLTGKVQDCGYNPSPNGSPGSKDSFPFIQGQVNSPSTAQTVYTDTDTKNNDSMILSNKSEWCNATTEKTDSLNTYNQQQAAASGGAGSATKVPSTGYSPLVVSLMIITAGAALAGGSVLAYNKLKK